MNHLKQQCTVFLSGHSCMFWCSCMILDYSRWHLSLNNNPSLWQCNSNGFFFYMEVRDRGLMLSSYAMNRVKPLAGKNVRSVLTHLFLSTCFSEEWKEKKNVSFKMSVKEFSNSCVSLLATAKIMKLILRTQTSYHLKSQNYFRD